MNIIAKLLSGKTVGEARSALYYLSRYLKQADHFEKYKKDIFEDAIRDYPDQETISLTWAIVSEQGISATAFNDSIYKKWATEVANWENSLDPEPSPAELEAASNFSNSMEMPKEAHK
jgi:hypothetical protein